MPTQILIALAIVLVGLVIVVWQIGGRPESATAVQGPQLGQEDRTYQVGSVPEGYDAAVAVAVKAMPMAFSYDYSSLSRGLDQATALMAEGFGAEFRRTFQSSAADLAKSKQAVTRATVRSAGVVRAEGDAVDCLVYLDQVLVSSETMKDRDSPLQVSKNRVLVGLVRSGDEWKIDAIKPF